MNSALLLIYAIPGYLSRRDRVAIYQTAPAEAGLAKSHESPLIKPHFVGCYSFGSAGDFIAVAGLHFPLLPARNS